MTEHQAMLEKAARALALYVKAIRVDADDTLTHLVVGKKFTSQREDWNPTTNPAQCAGMEAKLHLDILWYDDKVIVSTSGWSFTEMYCNHKSKNHARMFACTKAAAFLGGKK